MKDELAYDNGSNHAAAALMRELQLCEGLVQIRLSQTAVHGPRESGRETSSSIETSDSINLCVFLFVCLVVLKIQEDAEKVAN